MPKCALLDSHIAVVLPGYYKPCCQYTKYHDIYRDINVSEMTHSEYKSMDQFKRIKVDMKEGWHKGCEKCRLDEENGRPSYRQDMNAFVKTKNIEIIEISLSNYCNLSCKMCNPYASSKWENYVNENPDLNNYFSNKKTSIIEPEEFFKDVDLKFLRRIKYLGGEPFITPETKKLFDYLEEKNIIQNVQLLTNTNCTFFPKKWLNQLLKFKSVWIGLSVDGFEKSCEYSRTGSKWQDIEKNIWKWKELAEKNSNLKIYFSTTVNALTIHDFGQLKLLQNKLKIGMNPYVLHFPDRLRIDALPLEYLASIKDEHNKEFVESAEFKPDLFEKLKHWITTTDSIQNIYIKDYIPELAYYIDNYKT